VANALCSCDSESESGRTRGVLIGRTSPSRSSSIWKSVGAVERLPGRGSLNVQRAAQPTLQHPHRSRLPWIRALLLEARRSDLVLSIFKRSRNRNKSARGRKGNIHLIFIILGAIVVVILGLYSGLASSHHH